MPFSTAGTPVAIGLGTNLGDREKNAFEALLGLLRLPAFHLIATSSLYESEPWGDPDQDPFLNAVVLGTWEGTSAELLAALQRLEERLGKKVVRRWGPRNIDLDLLLFGEQTSASEALALPHPRIRERPFVVHPLSEAMASGATFFPGLWQEQWTLTPEGLEIDEETQRLEPREFWPMAAAPKPKPGELRIETPAAMRALAGDLARRAKPGDVFALVGPLGAGKTCFAGGFARGLGVSGPIASPTYTLCREYTESRLPFQHWDFYRLEGGADLESTGFPESAENRRGVLLVEWANLFPAELPAERTTWIAIERPSGGETRIVRLSQGAPA
ncbi:MAG: 2-amino-4-hydroxy-6-hydroxymethyldihydropteridine diphosphokinase [Sumerlaeia bacterium]